MIYAAGIDVGSTQTKGATLASKPFGRIGIGRGAADHLERHRPIEPRVPRRIHDAHPPLAEGSRDLVMSDLLHRRP